MKLEIAPEVLRDLTAWAVRATPRKPTLPVYGQIRLTASSDGTLTAEATDAEVWHSAAGECIPGEPGVALVPGQLLARLASQFSRRNVVITGGDHDRLSLECGAANFTLPTMPPGEHPLMPTVTFEAGKIGGQVLADALAATLPVIDTGQTVASLHGVEFTVCDGKAEFTSTDGNRLATCEIPFETTGAGSFTVIIPAETLVAVQRAAAEAATVTILLDGDPAAGEPNLTGFTTAGQVMVTRVLAGPYVSWRRRFNTVPPDGYTAIVDGDELTTAIRRVCEVMADFQPVRMTWKAGHVLIAAGESERAGQDRVPVEWEDGNGPEEEILMGMNAQFIAESLAAVLAHSAHITVWGPKKQVMVLPAPGERLANTRCFMQPWALGPAAKAA